jgi:hypothetical protein
MFSSITGRSRSGVAASQGVSVWLIPSGSPLSSDWNRWWCVLTHAG